MAKAADRILFYGQKGPYAFLSNFYPAAIELDGKTWSSVEHRYQAMKTTDRNLQEDIRLGYPLGAHAHPLPDRASYLINLKPGESKKKGQRIKKRDDWETVKELFMYEALKEKFSIPE